VPLSRGAKLPSGAPGTLLMQDLNMGLFPPFFALRQAQGEEKRGQR